MKSCNMHPGQEVHLRASASLSTHAAAPSKSHLAYPRRNAAALRAHAGIDTSRTEDRTHENAQPVFTAPLLDVHRSLR